MEFANAWYLFFTTMGAMLPALANDTNPLPFERTLSVYECKQNGECDKKPLQQNGPENILLHLKKFKKGGRSGLHGENHFEMKVQDVPFKSEIFVNKFGLADYSVSAVVRYGAGKNRRAISKQTKWESMPFDTPTLVDEKISVDGKFYRVVLKFGHPHSEDL